MTLEEFLAEPEIDPHQWLRDAAAGKMVADPLYDMAIEICDMIEQEVTQVGTSWHDQSLHDHAAEIIRRRLRETISDTKGEH